MTQITSADIKNLARLACIEINDNDHKTLTEQVSATINWVAQLQEINPEKVEPMISVHQNIMPLSSDEAVDGDNVEDIIRNATNAKYNYFSVPKVIE